MNNLTNRYQLVFKFGDYETTSRTRDNWIQLRSGLALILLSMRREERGKRAPAW